MPNRVVVTGATGFVGSALYFTLNLIPDYEVTGVCRTLPSALNAASALKAENIVGLGDLETADFLPVLKDVDVVIHTAGRAHVSGEDKLKALADFRRTNVGGTLNLARQAVEAGVKRFVFISSIGVNGGSTKGDTMFSETDLPQPHTPYALSKLEAEVELQKLCQESGMELVIVRPPLIYAAHAPGNFGKLLKAIGKSVPLPFALVKNQRSFVALENVVDFIIHCATHPNAANETFLIADNEHLSTPELCRFVSAGMGRSPILWPVPVMFMNFGAKLMGKKAMFEQLCGSLLVDNSKARTMLGWQAPMTAAEAMARTGQQLISSQPKKLEKYV